MDRLTWKYKDGGVFVDVSEVNTYECDDVLMHTGNAIKKLSEYEDLEERGQLIKIPFYEGETAYVIRQYDEFNGEITEREFIGLNYHISGISLDFSGEGGIQEVKLEKANSLAFHTREEAEKALKELNESQYR